MSKAVFNHSDYSRVGYYKTLLEDARIPCFIRNENADGSMMGGVFNLTIFNPTLCVVQESDYTNARALIEAHEQAKPQSPSPDWRCRQCGEEVPGDFDTCWNCGEVDSPPNPKKP